MRNVIANIAIGFLLFVAFVFTVDATVYRQTFDSGQAASSRTQDLVFVGTVKDIYMDVSSNSQRNWVVVTNVDRVVSGEFSSKTFSFRIHSPTLMGLRVGRASTIKAKGSEDGYLIDDSKRLKPVASRPRTSKNN